MDGRTCSWARRPNVLEASRIGGGGEERRESEAQEPQKERPSFGIQKADVSMKSLPPDATILYIHKHHRKNTYCLLREPRPHAQKKQTRV